MKVVDETRSIRAIEEKIAGGLIEELIYQAHNELKLIRIMKSWKPWEYIFSEVTEKEAMINIGANVRAEMQGDPSMRVAAGQERRARTSG